MYLLCEGVAYLATKAMFIVGYQRLPKKLCFTFAFHLLLVSMKVYSLPLIFSWMMKVSSRFVRVVNSGQCGVVLELKNGQ